MNQVLDEARSKGILVLAVNGDLVGNEDHRDANILPVDFTKTGPNQVELMGTMIDYKGEIAILSATTEAPPVIRMTVSMNSATSVIRLFSR